MGGFRFRGKRLLSEQILKTCDACNKAYMPDHNFCPECGAKLKTVKSKVYANYGKNGLTSLSYVLPNGTTFNTRSGMTMSLGNGISYTSK